MGLGIFSNDWDTLIPIGQKHVGHRAEGLSGHFDIELNKGNHFLRQGSAKRYKISQLFLFNMIHVTLTLITDLQGQLPDKPWKFVFISKCLLKTYS